MNLKHKVEDWAGNRDVQVIHVKVAIRSIGVTSPWETRSLEADPCGTSTLRDLIPHLGAMQERDKPLSPEVASISGHPYSDSETTGYAHGKARWLKNHLWGVGGELLNPTPETS